MNRKHRYGAGVGLLAGLLALGAGCSSANGESTGRDAGGDVEVATDAGVRVDGSDAGASSACSDYFDALQHCNNWVSPLLPATEIARVKARYEQHCAAEQALPGSGFAPAAIEACAAAVKTQGCIAVYSAACDFSGTLADGAPCAGDEQCSGACELASFTDAGGGFGLTQLTCGTCRTIAVGAPCPLDPVDQNICGQNAVCRPGPGAFGPGTDGGMPSGVCTARATAGAGQACGEANILCVAGTYCLSSTGKASDAKCVPAGGSGASCPEFSFGNVTCAAGLVCRPTGPITPMGGNWQCLAPAAAGVDCAGDDDCAAPLGCALTAGASAPTCQTVTFVADGEKCDNGATRCLRGTCSAQPGTAGTCAAPIADGQPCTGGPGGGPLGPPPKPGAPMCDAFASCVNGECTLGFAKCP